MLKYCLDRPREELYQRIDARMDAMLAAGLIDEAKNTPISKAIMRLKRWAIRKFTAIYVKNMMKLN